MSSPPTVEPLQEVGGVAGLPTETGGDPDPQIASRSARQLFWGRLRADRVALAALVVIGVLVLVAIFAPLIVKLTGAHPPNEQDTTALTEFGLPSGPSFSAHLYMGTDDVGRDIFSRVLYGARISLLVATITTAIAIVVGGTLGMLAGYYRGWADTALSRLFEVMLAFPVLLLAVGLGAACSLGDGCLPVNYDTIGAVCIAGGVILTTLLTLRLLVSRSRARDASPRHASEFLWRCLPGALLVVIGLALLLLIDQPRRALIQPGLPVVIVIIALVNVPYMARIIRGQVLSLREKEFIEAARSLGASDSRILFRHILPNLVAPIVVYATLLIPQNILFEAALSFLGVGVQPPTASWGGMIASAVSIFDSAWWYMTFPGLALLVCVLAFNLVGDGLHDAVNPRRGT